MLTCETKLLDAEVEAKTAIVEYVKFPSPVKAYQAYALIGISMLIGIELTRTQSIMLIEMFRGALEYYLEEIDRLQSRAVELSQQSERRGFRDRAETYLLQLHQSAGAFQVLSQLFGQLSPERHQRHAGIFQEAQKARANLSMYLASDEAVPLLVAGAPLLSELGRDVVNTPEAAIWWHIQVDSPVGDALATVA